MKTTTQIGWMIMYLLFFVSCNMNVEKKAGNNDDKQFGKCFVAKVDDGSKIRG